MEEPFDAIVVGSGATGGWAAKDLTERGLRVAVLEAGPEAAARGAGAPVPPQRQSVQSLCDAHEEATAHLFVDDVDNPYTHPEGKPFRWIRGRQVGGRLRVWGRTSVRMSDFELKAAGRDGVGVDWPLSYADLAPYYDRVSGFMRVCGTREGLPQLPDGPLLEPPRLVAGERDFKRAVESRWPERRVTDSRAALAPPEAMLAAAAASGRLTLRTGAVAARVPVDPRTGRARGVAYVDRESGREAELVGRVVVLCASTIESTRLLLNSATDRHPEGLGGSSGALGRYLMDHTYGVGLDGIAPRGLRGARGRFSNGCLIPSFRNLGGPGADFLRGYEVELGVSSRVGGWRRSLRGAGSRADGRFWMRAFGEVLPRFENRVTLEEDRTDAWGIPIVRIECAYGENEERMAADQARSMREMAEAAGWRIESHSDRPAPPGLSVHELGTARMGADPEGSVLDPYNQCWEVPNLFVTDGACFPSGGYQNPTLTMMALTARACERIAARMSAGEL